MTADQITWAGGKQYPHNDDGIADPIRLSRGHDGYENGWFWAWPLDGYYDLHFVGDSYGTDQPDGCDVYVEQIQTLAECRRIVKMDTRSNRRLAQLEAWADREYRRFTEC